MQFSFADLKSTLRYTRWPLGVPLRFAENLRSVPKSLRLIAIAIAVTGMAQAQVD
jgi:hypothetical protein